MVKAAAPPPLALEQVLAALAAADSDREAGGDGAPWYVVMHGFDPEAMREPPPDDMVPVMANLGFREVGRAGSLGQALRLLWAAIEDAYTQMGAPESQIGPPWQPWAERLEKWLREGPWSVPETQAGCAKNFMLGAARHSFPRGRYVIALFGDAPYEGEAAAVLELAATAAASKPAKKRSRA
jgi:hypothetical protein